MKLFLIRNIIQRKEPIYQVQDNSLHTCSDLELELSTWREGRHGDTEVWRLGRALGRLIVLTS